jgi:amino acid transporter
MIKPYNTHRYENQTYFVNEEQVLLRRTEMDKIKKYKRQSLYWLIAMIVVGIMVYSIFMQFIRLGNTGLVTLPLLLTLTVWIVSYVEYTALKIKIEILNEIREILKEIRGEEHNKPN